MGRLNIGRSALLRAALVAWLDPAIQQKARLIETHGCMAQDGAVREGIVIERYSKTIYNGNPEGYTTEFCIIRLCDTGETEERATEAAYKASDGALEWRE